MDAAVVVLIELGISLCINLSLVLTRHLLNLINRFHIDFFEDNWLHLIHDVLNFLSLSYVAGASIRFVDHSLCRRDHRTYSFSHIKCIKCLTHQALSQACPCATLLGYLPVYFPDIFIAWDSKIASFDQSPIYVLPLNFSHLLFI